MQLSVAHPQRIDPRLGAQQTLRELHVAHLQREEQHRLALLERSVCGHAERERRLSHGRAGADDVERVRLQPVQFLIKIEVARRDAGDRIASLVEHLQTVEVEAEQITQRRHRVCGATLRHVEHHCLGTVDGGSHVVRQPVADLGNLASDTDETTQKGVFLHDAGVVTGIRRGRRASQQTDERARTSDHVDQTGAPKLVGDGDGIGRLALCIQAEDGIEDMPVCRPVEVGGGTHLCRDGDRLTAEQHGAKERLLGLHVVRKQPGATTGPGAWAGRLTATKLFQRSGHGTHRDEGIRGRPAPPHDAPDGGKTMNGRTRVTILTGVTCGQRGDEPLDFASISVDKPVHNLRVVHNTARSARTTVESIRRPYPGGTTL